MASGVDRHLDITFGLQLAESSSLVSVLFREAFNHPYISFFHLLISCFSVTCFRSFFEDPLPSFNWWAISVGGIGGRAGIKMASASTPSVNEPARASL